jgi:hypothetical protein
MEVTQCFFRRAGDVGIPTLISLVRYGVPVNLAHTVDINSWLNPILVHYPQFGSDHCKSILSKPLYDFRRGLRWPRGQNT